MQGSIIMMLALGGLGCQNKGCDVFPTPQTTRVASAQSWANVCPTAIASSGYSACSTIHDTSYDASGYSARSAFRSTLWSFVIGHDPDVATVREIEATFYSSGSGH
jgi:hypothetical protein